MDDAIDIAQVARATGLSARALRFYEARGLVRPLRTGSGRRCYGRAELARLNAIVALKQAGFSLAEIGRMLAHAPPDLGRMIAAQIEELDSKRAAIDETRRLLQSVQSRIDRGEPIDVATLCSLIRQGAATMEPENWKTVTDRYFSPEEKARWAEAMPAAGPGGFDQEAYSRQWSELSAKIEAALPLDPASAEAKALWEE